MVERWQWTTLALVMIVTWAGCSSSEKHPQGTARAGMANLAGSAGGNTSDGGDAGDPGRGGNLGAKGGSAGASAVGGMGQPSVGGMAAVAGSAGRPVPASWACASALYGDGTCHCGCGIADPDCADGAVEACAVCNTPGSCNSGACPGRIQKYSNGLCDPAPVEWSCNAALYADGESCDCGCGAFDPDCRDKTTASCDGCGAEGACGPGECANLLDPANNAHCKAPPNWSCVPELFHDGVCHCGCGALDIDCPDATAAACDSCPASSCSPFNCAVLSNNNPICFSSPSTWHCDVNLYNDGFQCDCGCGYLDPDCAANHIDACATCNTPGACSGQPCPGTVDPHNVAFCTHPDPPDGWLCDKTNYADGLWCDCGCGEPDPDCRTSERDSCARCTACSSFTCDGVDPTDTTQCIPIPEGWTCYDSHYRDGSCDCGCGVRDPDCIIAVPGYCATCPEEGCSQGDCGRINPSDETQCR